jgi:hypothetical protein
MQTLETHTNKRTIHFLSIKIGTKKTKKVWDVLKNLWLNKLWTWKSDLSINHDNILYK